MSADTSERIKYEKMWAIDGYRKNSPGEKGAVQFLDFNPNGSTLVDLGCGTGRAGKRLSSRFKVTLFDIADNCLDPGISLPFVHGVLWEALPKADWGFCCDVLEHIPTDKVDEVLDRMSDAYKGVYLRIFLKEDKFGKEIGEDLHLTVKPYCWWDEKIRERWKVKFTHGDELLGIWLCQLSG